MWPFLCTIIGFQWPSNLHGNKNEVNFPSPTIPSPQASEPFRPLPLCTMFGKGPDHRCSEKCQHKIWFRPCSGAGRLLTAVGHSVQPHAWMCSLLHSLTSFLSLSPAQDAFWTDQKTLSPITSIPCGPWHSRLKQWLLRKSQTFRLSPSPNCPTNLPPPTALAHTTNLTDVCMSHIQFFPCLNPKSPSLLPHIIRTSHLHLDCGVANSNKWRGWIWNTSVSVGLVRGHRKKQVCQAWEKMCPTTKMFTFRCANAVLARQRCLPTAFGSKGNSLGPLI